ncbi:unnamed protein product [Symbiodinium natans]|uniref:Uncharacterized protein n=1 Tax=Symbiodinium natans TaxID=878477 RepID=A0A812N8R4_9DINO|nr:unnamed protein product [Symbiodinium natans]
MHAELQQRHPPSRSRLRHLGLPIWPPFPRDVLLSPSGVPPSTQSLHRNSCAANTFRGRPRGHRCLERHLPEEWARVRSGNRLRLGLAPHHGRQGMWNVLQPPGGGGCSFGAAFRTWSGPFPAGVSCAARPSVGSGL